MLLKQGSTGQDVTYLQYGLRIKCYDVGTIDGQFGPATYNAVIKYQKSKGLTADGIVGDGTWNTLKADIREVQQALNNKGYSLSVDGVAGPNTYNAVISFQKANGLTADGMVGSATWSALRSSGNTGNTGSTGNTGGAAGNRASANLIYFIKECEGFAPSLYKDVVGVVTGGYGMTGAEINGLPSTISEATATQLLTRHVNDGYYSKVLSIIKARGVSNPSQREVDAFTSFAYNLGVEAFKGSTLLKVYASGSRGEEIHNEFKKWVYADGKIYQGLVIRREKEWGIFSGSSTKIGGYNCPPSIAYVDKNGNSTSQTVKDNNGYGANPY